MSGGGDLVTEEDINCKIEINVLKGTNCRVSGNINGVAIQEQELHCYIVTADGRTYTAISRIAPDIGWDIQVCQEPNMAGTGGEHAVPNFRAGEKAHLPASSHPPYTTLPPSPEHVCSADRSRNEFPSRVFQYLFKLRRPEDAYIFVYICIKTSIVICTKMCKNILRRPSGICTLLQDQTTVEQTVLYSVLFRAWSPR
jgi:hypothetical protein